MALFGPRKDDSDLGDVGAAIDHVRQVKRDKLLLKELIHEYGTNCRIHNSRAANKALLRINRIINKYM